MKWSVDDRSSTLHFNVALRRIISVTFVPLKGKEYCPIAISNDLVSLYIVLRADIKPIVYGEAAHRAASP